MKQRRIGKGILVLVMAVAMLMGILPIAAMADSGIITSFDVPETAISVPFGTPESEMLDMLPGRLAATVNGASTDVAVTWEIDSKGLSYNGNADGVYTYRAVISGYTYAGAGATPTAVVTVGAGAGLLTPMSLSAIPTITLTDKVVVIDEATQTGYDSLELAMKAIGTNSGAYTVVFVGKADSATLSSNDRTAVTNNGANADITFTSKYYASEAAAASDTATTRTITLGTIVAGAKSTTFKDIIAGGTTKLYGNFRPLTIGEGFVNATAGSIYGRSNTTTDTSGDTNLTISSGYWGEVFASTTETGTTPMNGDANLTIDGQAKITYVLLNGRGTVTGDITANINLADPDNVLDSFDGGLDTYTGTKKINIGGSTTVNKLKGNRVDSSIKNGGPTEIVLSGDAKVTTTFLGSSGYRPVSIRMLGNSQAKDVEAVQKVRQATDPLCKVTVSIEENAKVTGTVYGGQSTVTGTLSEDSTVYLKGNAMVANIDTGKDSTGSVRNIVVASGSNATVTGTMTAQGDLVFEPGSRLNLTTTKTSNVQNLTVEGSATLGLAGGAPVIKVAGDATFAGKLNVDIDYDSVTYADKGIVIDLADHAKAANAYANISENRVAINTSVMTGLYSGLTYNESDVVFSFLSSDEDVNRDTGAGETIYVGGYVPYIGTIIPDSLNRPQYLGSAEEGNLDVLDLKKLFKKSSATGDKDDYTFDMLLLKMPNFSGYFTALGDSSSPRNDSLKGVGFNSVYTPALPREYMTFGVRPGMVGAYESILENVGVVIKSADGSKLSFIKRVFDEDTLVGYLAVNFTILRNSKVMNIDYAFDNITENACTPLLILGSNITYAGRDYSKSISTSKDIAFAYQSATEPMMYCWNDNTPTGLYGAVVGDWRLGELRIANRANRNEQFTSENAKTSAIEYDTELGLQWLDTVEGGSTLTGSGGIAFGDPNGLAFTETVITFTDPAFVDSEKVSPHSVVSLESGAMSLADWKYGVPQSDGMLPETTPDMPTGITVECVDDSTGSVVLGSIDPAKNSVPGNGMKDFKLKYKADSTAAPGDYKIRHEITVGAAKFGFTDTVHVERTESNISVAVKQNGAVVDGAIANTTITSANPIDTAKPYYYFDATVGWTFADSVTGGIESILVNGKLILPEDLAEAKKTNQLAFPGEDMTEDKKIEIILSNSAALTVKKTVTAPEGVTAPADDFTFTVSTGSPLAAYAGQGYALYGSDDIQITTDAPYATGTDGTFTLKAGQYAVFADIANDTPYQVVETVPGNYTCDKPNATVADTLNANATETFTNTYVPPTLTVNKTVAGEFGSKELDFDFTVTVKQGGTAYNGTLTCTGTDLASITLTNGSGTFKLHHGQSIVLSGIPQGATATVSEMEVTPYVTTYKIDTAAEGTAYLPAADPENPPAGAAVTMSEPHTVSFTNTNDTPPASGITLRKYVLGAYGDTTKLFTFSITAKDKDGNALSGPLHYKLESDTSETPTLTEITLTNGVGTVELKHGDSIVITDMPSNGKITVTEDKTGVAGYNTMLSVDEGTRSAALDPATTGEVPLDGATSKKFYFYNESNIVPTAVKLGGSGGNTGRMLLLISLLVLLAMTIMMLVMVVKRSYRPARRARH